MCLARSILVSGCVTNYVLELFCGDYPVPDAQLFGRLSADLGTELGESSRRSSK